MIVGSAVETLPSFSLLFFTVVLILHHCIVTGLQQPIVIMRYANPTAVCRCRSVTMYWSKPSYLYNPCGRKEQPQLHSKMFRSLLFSSDPIGEPLPVIENTTITTTTLQQEKEPESAHSDTGGLSHHDGVDGSSESSRVANNTTVSDSIKSDNQRPERQKNISKRPVPPQPAADPTDFPDWSYGPRDFFHFELIHQSSKSQARVGRIHTPHGIIDTPGFVAVATNAALKGVDFRQVDTPETNQQLIFANTYHLMIQPGPDVIADAGGIHQWTKRLNRPFITDSGGFQVFSLKYGSVHEELSSKGELKRAAPKGSKFKNNNGSMGVDAVKVTEEGVVFRSYRDGNKFLLTPETTIQAQKQIGADIIIPLDELPGFFTDRMKLIESVDRTHRWEARSLQEHLKNVNEQAIYCVVHGGIDKELRTKSIEYLTSLPFDGYAIGGSLGDGKEDLKNLLSWMMPLFDEKNRKYKPRHLLGIADEESIRNAAVYGIDTMDSCYPTRVGRHGTALARTGPVRLRKSDNKRAFNVPIDKECKCSTCQHYDRAYLWHLFKANEALAVTLVTQHNIHYMNDLMASIRTDIMNDVI